MSTIDWIVLLGTILFIVCYGVYKSRGSKDIDGYFLGDKSMKWWTIGLSIMATQASAITFLSTPGQAYADGMGFIQFYFGLPLAMVILSITVIPIYYRLKVYTAYEFLEGRFDLKTRSLAALLFLIQRGLAAGITIYAPAIILSSILGLNLNITILFIGVLVIIYTVSGGTKAVSVTQKYQMAVMMGGMVVAGIVVVQLLPADVSFNDALHVAGKMNKLDILDFSFDPESRYTIWSGLTGGLFLFLSYFGTDQSQVARYLTGKSVTESRLGLMLNGLLKIPMQFMILFIGVMVFVFYQFNQPPVFFNQVQKNKIYETPRADDLRQLEAAHTEVFNQKREEINSLITAVHNDDEAGISEAKAKIAASELQIAGIRQEVTTILEETVPDAEPRDTDYVFITFVIEYLPQGLVGLLMAVIFSAAMSSTSSELNALASTTTVDIYKRSINQKKDARHYLTASKGFTVLWGMIAIAFASFASLFENLIQAVNLLGSLFYGTILGIFLVAFYIKMIKGNAVFIAALMAELVVLFCHYLNTIGALAIGYLWYNLIGCVLVMMFGYILQKFSDELGMPQ